MTDPSDLFSRLATEPCLVIGEVGLAHDGDLDVAQRFIDVAADAGANAVKFQTHIAAAESTSREDWRVRFSDVDATRFDYWERTAFDEQGWKALKSHADDRGIGFLSSPFSVEAAELLLALGIKTWKVASGEVTDLPVIDFMTSTGLSTIVSTGLASHKELGACLSLLREGGCEVALMKCTSEYPCPPERVGLSAIKALGDRYECPVGISDHSGTIYAGIAAAALGAQFIEVHIKLTDDMPGPDAPASLDPNDLGRLVEGVRAVVAMVRAEILDQDETAAAASDLRRLFMKSVVAARALTAGDILGPDDVAVKKPADGLPPSALKEILGKRITRNMKQDDLIQMEDLEG